MFGFEESCGYLRGTHCRDKDAVVASMLFAEMVCYYTYNNIGVYERLNQLYAKYGYVFDTNVSVQYSGLNAMKEMNAVVDKMKTLTIDSIADLKVVAVRDYSKAERKTSDGKVMPFQTAKCNAVYYELDGGSFICVRPSGTEPKLKIYYQIKAKTKNDAMIELGFLKSTVDSIL